MKKTLTFLLLLVLYTSNMFSQGLRYNDIIYPNDGTKGNTSIVYWDKSNLNYYIHNNASTLTYSQCLTAIQNAFNTWSQYSDFTFTQTYNQSQADIELSWEPINHSGCQPFGSSDIAHSTLGKFNRTPPCFIHFNDTFTFTMNTSPYNLEAVALHEIGHVLGLPHDSITSAVMYEYYAYKTALTKYDLNALYSIYGFPHLIVGPHLIDTSATFYLDDLPSGFTVAWSLSNNYYNQNCFQQNYPSTNQCTITRSTAQDMMDATLTAYVIYNGDTIRTLTMDHIYAYSGFKGHYASGNLSGDINYTHVFTIKNNEYTYVTSPNFAGAQVTYDTGGAIPSFWAFYSGSPGDLRFIRSSDNTYTPVIINVYDVCGNYYQLYAYPSSCYLNVSTGDQSLTITLNEDDESSEGRGIDQPWTLEVRSATTGELKVMRSETSKSASVSTSGWPKGIYIVKATWGSEGLTEKIVLK